MSTKRTAHKTGLPIAALDISPARTHAILAGRDILKTIQVSGSTCAEDFNLRAAIIAYASTHHAAGGAISATHKDQLAATDVKWSHGKFDSTVATAAANGQIVVYDINRPGVEYARLHEHVRQVHRVAFNPHQGALLLSGSQDATVRLWDLRDLAGDRSILTARSQLQFPGNNEGIRDVKWSPTEGVEFAVGTDNGVIQRWDIRKPKVPILKVNAHDKTCHSIDWHPDGKHLVSGGADKNVSVWDFSSTDRRKKPCWQIRAPQAVLNVRWRPPCWNTEDANPGTWLCTQLATSYDNQDPRVHVWDFRRPFVPVREIDRYDAAPSAMLWHSENLLWSVGSAGVFTQTDINFEPIVSDRRSPNVVAMAPNGQIRFFSEKKARRRRSLQDAAEELLHRKIGGSAERLSGSQSLTDGSLEEPSLWSSSFKHRHRKAPGTVSLKSLTTTPPSAVSGGLVLKLDEAMQTDVIFHHAQAAANGRILGLFDEVAFKHLARHYRTPPVGSIATSHHQLHRELGTRFQENAVLAAQVNQYQLAQSWRILGFAIEKELASWSCGLAPSDTQTVVSIDFGKRPSARNLNSDASNAAQGHGRDLSVLDFEKARGTLKVPLAPENSSNMTTPLARPVPDTTADAAAKVHAEIPDGYDLPGPAWEKQLLPHQTDVHSDSRHSNGLHASHRSETQKYAELTEPTISPRSSTLHSENTAGSLSRVGFPDMDHHLSERRVAMESYRAKPRPLLRLDEPMQLPRSLSIPSLERHDSNESFPFFSASTDSSHRANSFVGSFGSSQESEKSDPAPKRFDHLTGHQTERSYRDVHETSRHGPTLSVDPNSSLPRNTFNYSAPALSVGKFVQAKDFSPPLRPSNIPSPIIHFEDMDQKQKLEFPAVDSGVQPESRHEPPSSPLRQNSNHKSSWTATSMLDPLITYHANDLSSSQLPANLLLQLGPHLSSSISPALILSILLSYHAQLDSLSLFPQAAHLRNLAHPVYPDVFNHGTYGITPGGPWCTVCQKPSKGDKPDFCERCKHRWADCPICDGEGPIPTHTTRDYGQVSFVGIQSLQSSDSLWGWCQWCGHGGHVGCLQVWWANAEVSEGGCATAGCLHDCVAGTRRNELIKRKSDAKKVGAVRGDEWVVRESRAVERTRGLVGGEVSRVQNIKGQGQPRSKTVAAGQGPLSIGMMGRSASGGKKVRLLVPQGDGEGLVGTGAEDINGASASVP